LATSSVYCDKDLRDDGFPFECHLRKQRTVLVKTHERRAVQRYHRAILLVRNPNDALLAYYNFVKGDHKKIATDFVLRKASHELFNHAVRWWLALFYETLQTFKNRVYVLQYETLKENTKDTLTDLARFLEIPVSEHDVTCTLRLQEGRHHRQTSEAEHLRLLNVVYDKPKLKKVKRGCEKS
ncbi:WSCD1-like protein, partial [Mya arenaria]